MSHTCYLANRTPARGVGTTPFASLEGEEYEYSMALPLSGQVCYANIPKSTRIKLSKPSYKGLFLGFDNQHGSKHYHIFNVKTKTMKISKDVKFTNFFLHKRENDENVNDESNCKSDSEDLNESSSDDDDDEGSVVDSADNTGVNEEGDADVEEKVEDEPELMEIPTGLNTGLNGPHWEAPAEGSSRIERATSKYIMHVKYPWTKMSAIIYAIEKIVSDPKSVNEAKQRSDWKHWKATINAELPSMEENDVLRPVKG